MSCLGVHFSLSSAEVEKLRACTDDAARLEYLQEEIEEEFWAEHPDWVAQSDKAWDAMHRVLADGTMDLDGGEYPLNSVVLGGISLYGKSDYIMSLKDPKTVADVAAALPGVTEEAFRTKYFAIDPDDYGFPVTDEDFEYTWQWFQEVREVWLKAASEGRWVLFTADQ
jgi:hypothetical protein